jgi:hypothetical protein
MEIAGGYVLHLDAMHEGEAPVLPPVRNPAKIDG